MSHLKQLQPLVNIGLGLDSFVFLYWVLKNLVKEAPFRLGEWFIFQ